MWIVLGSTPPFCSYYENSLIHLFYCPISSIPWIYKLKNQKYLQKVDWKTISIDNCWCNLRRYNSIYQISYRKDNLAPQRTKRALRRGPRFSSSFLSKIKKQCRKPNRMQSFYCVWNQNPLRRRRAFPERTVNLKNFVLSYSSNRGHCWESKALMQDMLGNTDSG